MDLRLRSEGLPSAGGSMTPAPKKKRGALKVLKELDL